MARWLGRRLRRGAASHAIVELGVYRLSPGEHSRRRVRENGMSALWVLILLGTGTVVLDGLSQNARHDECVMRGAALCSDARASYGHRSWRQTQATARGIGIAAYLKGSRNW
jgi:hypothetical protein